MLEGKQLMKHSFVIQIKGTHKLTSSVQRIWQSTEPTVQQKKVHETEGSFDSLVYDHTLN